MGGNIFNTTKPIIKQNINNTLQKYFDELSLIFPKKEIFDLEHFQFLGSAGKKETSGDIDLGLDISDFSDYTEQSLQEWNISKSNFQETFNKLKKRARTSTDEQLKNKTLLKLIAEQINTVSDNIEVDEKKVGIGNMFSAYPQYVNNKVQDYGVQIDWMVGNLELLKFSYFSSVYKGNVKGLHRTQLLLSIFSNLGMTFSHAIGVKDKKTQKNIATDPVDIVGVLNKGYNINLSLTDTDDYFKLMGIVLSLPYEDYSNIVDIYLKILDKTRADIPDNLQTEWVLRRKQLNLTGKFLPDNSNLKCFKSC